MSKTTKKTTKPKVEEVKKNEVDPQALNEVNAEILAAAAADYNEMEEILLEEGEEAIELFGVQDTIKVPIKTEVLQNGGGTRDVHWAAIFKRTTMQEHDTYIKAVAEGRMTDYQVLQKILVDWEKLRDHEMKLIKCDRIGLISVMRNPEYKRSLVKAAYFSMSGGSDLARKN